MGASACGRMERTKRARRLSVAMVWDSGHSFQWHRPHGCSLSTGLPLRTRTFHVETLYLYRLARGVGRQT